MNKTHRLIWNAARAMWIVTHEAAATRGRPGSLKRLARRALAATLGLIIAQSGFAAPPAPNALPTGGQVVSGQASISQTANAMTIRQSTDKAILEWQSFNIGSQASVHFQQNSASSIALNRVVGADPSAIYGKLSANGQVFLLNPNGVLFAPGAKVDVGGLVASTLNLRNEDFLDGNYRFTRDGNGAEILNRGELTAKYVALLAPEVKNEGIIAARMGTVALAAGDAVTLDIAGNALIDVTVDKATIDTLVENKKLVTADGGSVIMSARSANHLLGRVINSGTVTARGISTDGGVVRLLGSSDVEHSGSIDVSAAKVGAGGTAILLASLDNPDSRTMVSGSIAARGGSDAGNGGFIETSATHLKIADSAAIDTLAAHGKTGQWLLDPYDFTIAASGGDITGTALRTALNSNDVTIQTTNGSVGCAGATCGSGTSTGNGDIFVNDAVNWTGAHALTLNAWRNIVVNSAITVPAGGGLNLQFAQSDEAMMAPTGNYLLNAPINLAGSATFTTAYGQDGAGNPDTPITYTVLTNKAGLEGMSMTGNYVLGADVANAGTWTPIGGYASKFNGIFDGLGHTVDGISIQGANGTHVGMFGAIGTPGLVQNIGVTNVDIRGTQYVGALAGSNEGTIFRAYSTGTVTGETSNTDKIRAIGGLVGQNYLAPMTPGGVIDSAYSTVTVTATRDTNGNTYNGNLGLDGGIGGLVGANVGGYVTNSYASGSVAGIQNVGGLVGYVDTRGSGAIGNTLALGRVSLAATGGGGVGTNAGGLVGAAEGGSYANSGMSFWDKDTTQQTASAASSGAALGLTTAQMKTAANFTSATAANGNSNPMWDTAGAWKLVDGSYPVLVFKPNGSVTVVYVRLAATGTSVYGDSPTLSWKYYDAASGGNEVAISPTGTANPFYNGSAINLATRNVGTYALTYGSTSSLSLTNYSFLAGGATDWAITQRPITITPTSGQSKVYNGQTGVDPTLRYNDNIAAQLVNGDTNTLVGALSRVSAGTVNDVGNYAITIGGLQSGNTNYTLVLAATTVQFKITPKPLKVIGLTVPDSKTYDGNSSATVSGTPTLLAAEAVGTGNDTDGKPYTGDTVVISGTAVGTYDSPDAATAALVSFSGLSASNANYSLSIPGAAAKIKPPTFDYQALVNNLYTLARASQEGEGDGYAILNNLANELGFGNTTASIGFLFTVADSSRAVFESRVAFTAAARSEALARVNAIASFRCPTCAPLDDATFAGYLFANNLLAAAKAQLKK